MHGVAGGATLGDRLVHILASKRLLGMALVAERWFRRSQELLVFRVMRLMTFLTGPLSDRSVNQLHLPERIPEFFMASEAEVWLILAQKGTADLPVSPVAGRTFIFLHRLMNDTGLVRLRVVFVAVQTGFPRR